MPETSEDYPSYPARFTRVQKVTGEVVGIRYAYDIVTLDGWYYLVDDSQMVGERFGSPDTARKAAPMVARLRAAKGLAAALQNRLDVANATLTEVKVALGGVATYEGIVDVSPTSMLVSELVQDHEALEQRIENVLTYADDCVTAQGARVFDPHRVIALLRGASPFPDTIEGLTDGD